MPPHNYYLAGKPERAYVDRFEYLTFDNPPEALFRFIMHRVDQISIMQAACVSYSRVYSLFS
jgi:hypothetical protein